jgi:hypothetical protein
MNLFEAYDAELLAKHKSITPGQRAIEDQKRKLQRETEAKTMAIETESDRLDTDEYPIDND